MSQRYTDGLAKRTPDLVGDVLLLIELTDLGQRAAANGRELWALDCAQRAVGSDIRDLEPQLRRLKADMNLARKWLRQAPNERDEALAEQLAQARDHVQLLLVQNPSKRARQALEAWLGALDCVAGQRVHEQVARTSLAAFPLEYVHEEADFQARRLLLRCKLVPSTDELLVRLDYAEARGALPRDPEARARLEQQRLDLMGNDEDRRVAFTLRYLDQVFLAEFERAR